MLHEYVDKIVVFEAERPRGQRNQRVDIYLTYIGQFTPPGCGQTFPEYQSPEDKRKEYLRDYYRRNKEKILSECAERYAAKKAAKPEPPAEVGGGTCRRGSGAEGAAQGVPTRVSARMAQKAQNQIGRRIIE
jgi:hypothetical protein